MRISDWSSDVCSSDLAAGRALSVGRAAGDDARLSRRVPCADDRRAGRRAGRAVDAQPQARRGRWRRNGALTRKLALGLIPALLIGACTVGPDYHAPEIAVPPAYQEAPTVAAPGAQIDPAYWWKAFGDPELDALVARALADNPTIAVAASRVRQARLQEIAAGARGLPTVDASGNATHVHFSKNAGFSSLAQIGRAHV